MYTVQHVRHIINNCYMCEATETGGMPPVTMTNETMPPPWTQQAALV